MIPNRYCLPPLNSTGMGTDRYRNVYCSVCTHVHISLGHKFMYPFPNSNGAAIEVENGGNIILYFYDLRSTSVLYWTCDYLSMLGLKLVHVSKGDQGVRGKLWLVAESGDLWSWALHTKRLLLLLWECPWNVMFWSKFLWPIFEFRDQIVLFTGHNEETQHKYFCLWTVAAVLPCKVR